MGLYNFDGFCGREELNTYHTNCLKVFGLKPSDILLCTTDCGLDVQSVAGIMGWCNFPCLAHINNLIVQKFVLSFTQEYLDDSVDEIDEASLNINSVVELVKLCVSDIHASSALHKKLHDVQVGTGQEPTKDN